MEDKTLEEKFRSKGLGDLVKLMFDSRDVSKHTELPEDVRDSYSKEFEDARKELNRREKYLY